MCLIRRRITIISIVICVLCAFVANDSKVDASNKAKCYEVFVAPDGTVNQYDDPVCSYAKIKNGKLVIIGSIMQVEKMFGSDIKMLKYKKRTFKLKKGYKLAYYEEGDGNPSEVKITKRHFNGIDGFSFYFKTDKKGRVVKILGTS